MSRREPLRALLGWACLAALLVIPGASPPVAALSFEGQATRIERELREGVSTQRVAAAAELTTLAPADAAPLVGLALDDPEIEVRAHAARAAGRLGLREAREITRAWLEDEDPELRLIAVRAEGELGDASSVPLLARALGDPRFAVRAGAAAALGLLGLPECAAPLGTALEDTDATVRVVAAEALGLVPGPDATRLLLSRSLDPALEVRAEVVEALARRADGDADAADPRVGAVLLAALADEAEEVRLAAVLGLARARDASAAGVLARLVDEGWVAPVAGAPGSARVAEESRLARAAVAALGRMDDPEARACVVRALGRPGLRPAALAALREQLRARPEATEDALAAVLRERPGARETVATALVELPELRGGDALTRALLASLEPGGAPLGALLPALGATLAPGSRAAEDAVVALLAGVEVSASAAPALDGLERAHARGALDARAVEPLVLLLASAGEELAPRVATLLGRLDDERAIAPLVALASGPSGALRSAALRALAGSSHVSPQDRPALASLALAALGSEDAGERLAAAALARRYGTAETLAALLDALEGSATLDRALAIEVVAAMSGRLDRGAEGVLAARSDRALVGALGSTDPRLSSAAAAGALAAASPALDALAGEALALSLREPRRGDALALWRAVRGAASQPAGGEARDPEAPLALAGAARGAELAARDELRFPASIVRSFALLTLARRGELATDDVRSLCALASRREPGVRANAGLALAAASVRCEGVDPLAWIERGRSVSVQMAGVRWAAALRPSLEPRRVGGVLEGCLERAADPALRDACAAASVGDLPALDVERGALVDVTVLDATGAPDASHLVSLRFPDGAVLVVETDRAGRVALRLDRVPGPVVVEDPLATVLER